jgi:acetoin utilization deacetylase AcuC-like enzyme
MLKKETLKQAIDAIAGGDPEIGYSLSELFRTGWIDTVENPGSGGDGGFDAYLFNGQQVPIRKSDYFMEGVASVEQSLLIQYGMMEEKQRLASSGAVAFSRVGEAVRSAGLRRHVRHEIRRAAERLGSGQRPSGTALFPSPAENPDLPSLFQALSREIPGAPFPENADDPRVLFAGAVNADTPAWFTYFPYTFGALMQVAGLGLSYFSTRFILGSLLNATAGNLFACIVNGEIAGLVYLKAIRRFMTAELSIEYIASAGKPPETIPERPPVHRGVGTFLVAGVWMLWKNRFPRIPVLSLNTETAALGFYEMLGFEKKRPYVLTLKRPAGYLLNVLAVMADRSRAVSPMVLEHLLGWIGAHVRRVSRLAAGAPGRDRSLAFIKLCLLSRAQPRLARTAALSLQKHRSRIPEAEALLDWAASHGRIRLVKTPHAAPPPLAVFTDRALHAHLRGICHLENAGRLTAMDTVLSAPRLSGRWNGVAGRTASTEELAWVHTPAYISRVAATSEKPLHCLDPDTHTTEGSFDAARRAVGGVFSLLDKILAGPSRRGFAAVRPPGHHAGPDRAMGFCLFNNAALGASYLRHARGLDRVMIVDIDAHHGNGTQAAFFDSKEVLFLSMHQSPCFPGTGDIEETGIGAGEGYTVNVPLEKGMGDREFVQVIDRLAAPLACAFAPGMILVSCGFDLYRHDRLAQLAGTPEGYAMATRLLCRIAELVCDGKIAFIMEGGYSIKGIEACGRSVIQELCGIQSFEQSRLERILSAPAPPFPSLRKVIATHQKYWSILGS